MVRVWRGARLVELTHGKGPSTAAPPRGAVRGFSAASRRRLIRWVASVDTSAHGPGTFVTLTMPGSWRPGCDRPRDWKRHLDVWLHRLKRAFPQCWGLWRLEPQKRGAPHYHLLLWGMPAGSADWVARSWWEVVGSGELSHLRAGTRTEWMRSVNGTMFYAAKYCAKVVTDLPKGWAEVGRWWGVHRRVLAGRVAEDVRLSDSDWCQLRRWIRRLVNGPGRRRRALFDGEGLDPIRPHRVALRALVAASTVQRFIDYLSMPSIIQSVVSATNTAEIKAKGRGSFTVTTVSGDVYKFALVRTLAGPWRAQYWQRITSEGGGFFGESSAVDCQPPSEVIKDSEFMSRVTEAADAADGARPTNAVPEAQGG